MSLKGQEGDHKVSNKSVRFNDIIEVFLVPADEERGPDREALLN